VVVVGAVACRRARYTAAAGTVAAGKANEKVVAAEAVEVSAEAAD